jgi:hypothetical protein
VLQYNAQRGNLDDRNAAAIALASAIVGFGAAALDSADDRTWRALPSELSIARVRLQRGTNLITLHAPEGPRSVRVDVSGRTAVVDLRLLRHQLFVNAPPVRALPGSTEAK